MSDFSSRVALINKRIDAALEKAGRTRDSLRLLGVSKTHDTTIIREAISAGHVHFGENRIIEAREKFQPLRDEKLTFQLHFIGQLQSNKAQMAVDLCDVIETLDRTKLAIALARAVQKSGKCPRFFIEVNIGAEPYKGGIDLDDLPLFLVECRKVFDLTIDGLMCIPPAKEDATPYFQKMKNVADHHGLKEISMGMSNDFETAIACGATEIRVGTSLFGAR